MPITYTCPSGSAAGDAIYFTGATTVAFADVSDRTKIAQAVIFEKLSDTTCTLAFKGNLLNGLAGLTAGSKYYLTSTATTTNTLSTTQSGQCVGIAISTTQLYIMLEELSTLATGTPLVFGEFGLQNGAIYSTVGAVIIALLDNDNDCSVNYVLKIPDWWIDTTPTLKIMYLMNNAAGAWSAKFSMSSLAVGEVAAWNVMNEVAKSFTHAGVANEVDTYTEVLSGIAAGDVVSLQIASNAPNNPNYLGLLAVWLEYSE